MDSFNALTLHTMTWLLNYIVHSTILLGLAAIAHQLGLLKQRRLAELLWRTALFGGFVTASAQLGLQLLLQTPDTKNEFSEKKSSNVSLSFAPTLESNKVPNLDKRILEANSITPRLWPNESTFKPQPSKNVSLENSTNASDDRVIVLPANLQSQIGVFILIWLVYVLFIATRILLTVRHLNRLADAMPVIDRSDLNELLVKQFASANITARLRISTTFDSPAVCPNGLICLPTWALEHTNQFLCHAMLHHEIQHIIRRDSVWRIAYEFVKGAFFFQILNRVAERHLTLLAEMDCDHIAAKANGVNTFVQALVRCAEMTVVSKHPTFAIPMAKNTGLLQRINLILDEGNMNNSQLSSQKDKAIAFTFCFSLLAGSIALSFPITAIAFIDTNSLSTHSLPARVPNPISTLKNDVEESLELDSVATPPSINASKTITATITSSARSKSSSPILIQIESPTLSNQVSSYDQLLTQAKQALENKRYVQAFKMYSELAEHNNSDAQALKGEMLWYGDGIAADPTEAKVWLSKAAAQGHTKANAFMKMFAEREKRQAELDYYTTQFDGESLKWTNQTCEAVINALENADNENTQLRIKKINSVLDCYNNYTAIIQRSLKTIDYIPADLNQLMREEELEKAKQLARTVFFQQALRAKSHIESRLAVIQKQTDAMEDYRLQLNLRIAEVLRDERRQPPLNDLARPLFETKLPREEFIGRISTQRPQHN